MKKIYLFALALIVLFTGCQKESGNSAGEYYVSFSVNGTAKKYTGYTFGHTEIVGTDAELQVVGTTSTTTFDNYMGIYLNNYPGSGTFTTGEYTDASTSFTLLATYESGGKSYEAGQSVAEDAAANSITIANHFKTTITQINDKTIRGTFSGDFYENGDVQTGAKISITNGEFYVKFQ